MSQQSEYIAAKIVAKEYTKAENAISEVLSQKIQDAVGEIRNTVIDRTFNQK